MIRACALICWCVDQGNQCSGSNVMLMDQITLELKEMKNGTFGTTVEGEEADK